MVIEYHARVQEDDMNNFGIIVIYFVISIAVLMLRSTVYDSTVTPDPVPTENQEINRNIGEALTIHYHQRRPYYVGYQGEVYGLVANTVNIALKSSDVRFSWVETPAGRQLDIIRSNESKSCAAGWFKTDARQKYAKFSDPLYQDRPFVAVARADSELLKSRDSVVRVFNEYRLKLLIKRGYSYGNYLDKKIQELSPRQVITTADNIGMLKMVATHRADYCFLAEEEAHDLLVYSTLNRSRFKIVTFTDIPVGSNRYLICSKQVSDEELAVINNGINHVTKLPVVQ